MTVSVSVLDDLEQEFKSLQDGGSALADKLLRTITQGLYAQMSLRIFNIDGSQKADGSLIGAYNPKYYKQRVKRFGRTEKNVSLMATDQTHSAFGWGAENDGSYSIGFGNKLAADKSKWNEDRFGQIFSMSQNEIESITPIVSEFMQENFGTK